MAPPPPLPDNLRRRPEERRPQSPQPGQEEFYRRPDNWPGRGYLVRYVGEAIHRAQETRGNIRHDVLIERRVIGRILGKGGRDLEALQLCTGAEIFIIDKYPPPDENDDHRLLVLIGRVDQVRLLKEKIDAILERAREELPPLPPPLTSGWRPVPSVGPEADPEAGPEWVNAGGKRAREDDRYGNSDRGGQQPRRDEYRGEPAPSGRPDQYGDRGGYQAQYADRGGGYDRGGYDRGGYGVPDRYGGDHGVGYGRAPYDRAPYPDREQGPVSKKVGTCFDWQRGQCMRGDMCKFAHPPDQAPNGGDRF